MGFTALIGGIDATLDALDTALAGVAPAARAVLPDDSRELRPTLYAEGGPIAATGGSCRCPIDLANAALDAGLRPEKRYLPPRAMRSSD